MAKSLKTIYFSSQYLIEAEAKGLNVSSICNEALKIAVETEKNQGSTAGAFGNFLHAEVEKKKDIEIMKRLYNKKGINSIQADKFTRALNLFCAKYEILPNEALLISEGKKEK